MKYIPLAGFYTRLIDNLKRDEIYLPISDEDYDFLYEKLDEDDTYSYLEIRDGRAIEIVKIYNYCGHIYMERGIDCTSSLSFRCGSSVRFILTEESVKNLICQMEDEDCESNKCEGIDMSYIGIAGFISNLVEKYQDTNRGLPIAEEHKGLLLSRLGYGGYTYLEIMDGTQIEYIKVSNISGELVADRGLETTEPKTFPIGSCVKWVLTPMAVRDIICQMECCP